VASESNPSSPSSARRPRLSPSSTDETSSRNSFRSSPIFRNSFVRDGPDELAISAPCPACCTSAFISNQPTHQCMWISSKHTALTHNSPPTLFAHSHMASEKEPTSTTSQPLPKGRWGPPSVGGSTFSGGSLATSSQLIFDKRVSVVVSQTVSCVARGQGAACCLRWRRPRRRCLTRLMQPSVG
jgi:hypothetical protein